jgi:hypothetical protein
MKVTEWDSLFPHFAPEEYFSPQGLHLFFHKNIVPCDPLIVHCLESLRKNLNEAQKLGVIECDKEVTIQVNHGSKRLRGFVTPNEWYEHREKEPGQLYSFHLWCAADISSPEVSPEVLFQHAIKKDIYGFSVFNCIIQYDWGLHVDVRRGEEYYAKN